MLGITREEFDRRLAEKGLPPEAVAELRRDFFREMVRPSLKGKGKDPSTREIIQDWGVAKKGKANAALETVVGIQSGLQHTLVGEAARFGLNKARGVVGLPEMNPADYAFAPQTGVGKTAQFGAMLAGDLPLPAGKAVQAARGGLSIGRTALSAGAAGAATGAARSGLTDANEGKAPGLMGMLQGAAIEGGLGAGIGAGVAKVGNVLRDRAAQGIDHAVARQMADAHLGAQDAVINSQMALPAPGQTANAGWAAPGPNPEVVRAQELRNALDDMAGLTPAQRAQAFDTSLGQRVDHRGNAEYAGQFGQEGSLDALAMQLGPDLEVKPSDNVFGPGASNPIDPQMAAMRAQHQFDPLMQAQHQGLVNEYQAGLAADAQGGLNQFIHSNPRVTPPEQIPTGRHGRVKEVPAMEPYGYTRRHGREVPLMRPSDSRPGPTGQVGPSVPVASAAPVTISTQRAQAADSVAEILGINRLTSAEIPGAVQSLRQAAPAQSDPVLGQAMMDIADRLSGTPPTPNPAVEQLRLQFGDEFVNQRVLPTSAVEPGAAPSTATNPAADPRQGERGAAMFGVGGFAKNTPEARMEANISIGEGDSLTDKIVRAVADPERKILDRTAPIKRMASDLGAGDDFARDIDLLAGSDAKAVDFVRRGVRSADKHHGTQGPVDLSRDSMGLEQILQEARKTGPNGVSEFRLYATARQAKAMHAEGLDTGFSPQDVDEILARHGGKYDALFGELTKYHNAVLKYAMDAGVISEQQFVDAVAKHADYLPMYRVQDDDVALFGAGGNKLVNLGNTIFRRKGSTRKLVDPLEVSIAKTQNLVAKADRNMMAQTLVELAEKDPTAAAQWIRPATAVDSKNVVTIKRAGQDFRYVVDEDVAKALAGMSSQQIGFFENLSRTMLNVMRAGITLNPAYLINNPGRDIATATIQSKNGFAHGLDFVRGMVHIIGKSDLYDSWVAAGGGNATFHTMDRSAPQDLLREMSRSGADKFIRALWNPLYSLTKGSKIFEEATRVGDHVAGVRSARNQGKTAGQKAMSLLVDDWNPKDRQALGLLTADDIRTIAHNTRNSTQDFNKAGDVMKHVNSLYLFANARTQGWANMGKALARPKTWAMGAATVTAPSLALLANNMQDERWAGIKPYEKAMFWHVLIPGHPVYRIIKPPGYSFIFSTLPERLYEYASGNNPEAAQDILKAFTNELPIQDYIPTPLLPAVEAQTNMSRFTQRPIVPYGTDDLPAKYQQDERTTGIAKALGSLGASPAKVDHLIRGYGGPLAITAAQNPGLAVGVPGALAQMAINPVIRDRSKGDAPTTTAAELPLVGNFLSVYERGSDHRIDQLYTQRDRDASKKKEFDHLIENGRLEEAEVILAQDTPSLAGAQMAGTFTKALSALREQTRQIAADPTLSGAQKRAYIEEIRGQMRELGAAYRDTRRGLNGPPRI